MQDFIEIVNSLCKVGKPTFSDMISVFNPIQDRYGVQCARTELEARFHLQVMVLVVKCNTIPANTVV